MDPSLTVRPAVPADVPLLLALIKELADYERAPDQAVATPPLLHAALFGPRPSCEALVGLVAGQPQGFALYFTNFSTWLGRPGIYLEDLFVRPAARQRGLGKALLIELARIARTRDQNALSTFISSAAERAVTRNTDHETRKRDQSARQECVDEYNREGNAGSCKSRDRQENQPDDGACESTADSRNCDGLELSHAGVAPEAPINARYEENDKAGRDRYREVNRDEADILAHPPEGLKPYQESYEGRRNDRKKVRDEQVPVSDWLKRQKLCGLGWFSIADVQL
jgi:GNAT superfamily N-acetyltransferase